MSRTRAVQLILGISSIVLGCLLGWGCGGCVNQVLGEATSPDGRYRAIVFEHDCGATTGFSTQVSIIPAESSLSDIAGNAFIADDNHGAAPAGRSGGPEVNINWVSPTKLKIKHHFQARVFKAMRQVGAVQINYESIGN